MSGETKSGTREEWAVRVTGSGESIFPLDGTRSSADEFVAGWSGAYGAEAVVVRRVVGPWEPVEEAPDAR